MSKFFISTTKDNLVLNEGDQNIVYIFENVKDYEDEIIEMFEKNKMKLSQIEYLVKSWGGNLKVIHLKQLIKSYYKSLN
tara:strand:+ start:820 stop:1056 length:237 start_codon:yes stop_codon:yes gene_type:complete